MPETAAACSVLVDGHPTHSCIFPAHRIDGRDVVTASGLGTRRNFTPFNRHSWTRADSNVVSVPAGMVVTASALSVEQKSDLACSMKGNLCRCTGYRSIRDALAVHPIRRLPK